MTSAPRPAPTSRVPDGLNLTVYPGSGRTALSAHTGSHLAATITDFAVRWEHRAVVLGHSADSANDLRYAPYVTLAEDVAKRDFYERIRRESWGLLGMPRLRWAEIPDAPAILRADVTRSKRVALSDDALVRLPKVDNPSSLPNDAVGVCVVSAWAVPLAVGSPDVE